MASGVSQKRTKSKKPSFYSVTVSMDRQKSLPQFLSASVILLATQTTWRHHPSQGRCAEPKICNKPFILIIEALYHNISDCLLQTQRGHEE